MILGGAGAALDGEKALLDGVKASVLLILRRDQRLQLGVLGVVLDLQLLLVVRLLVQLQIAFGSVEVKFCAVQIDFCLIYFRLG